MINRKLKINPHDSLPIWQQIVEGVRRLVAAGVLAPGSLVTSVRDLAQELRVNPAIVAKAYQRLVAVGIFAEQRWGGAYVAEPPLEMSSAERKRILREEAMRYAAAAARAGATCQEATESLDSAMRSCLLRQGRVRYAITITRLGRKKLEVSDECKCESK
jgi:GntR family transcriptional regulator